jgi:2-polyprenyl-3-methyl-5-hydroxy-6-metoxy-1,4-benzoquinol methylase
MASEINHTQFRKNSMNLCYAIASRMYKRRNSASAARQTTERGNSSAAYWQWQFDSSAEYFTKFCDVLDVIRGKRVLEIGCGIGGRTCFLATQGVEHIVGTDINHNEIATARDLANNGLSAEYRSRVDFIEVSEVQTEIKGGPFDVVMLIDSLEHVRDPLAMLNHAWALTRPGGLCFFSTIGWYHHRASHVSSIVPIPFATVFFSDHQILDTVRKIVSAPYYKPSMWDSNPPVRRWEDVNNLSERPDEYLNKITIHKMKKTMQASRFTRHSLNVQGFSFTRWPVLRIFNCLTHIPLIREMYHSACFGRLEKSSANSDF